jgi:hypothetical protein
MKTAEAVFVIRTYRLRDVAETVETYDEHFWSNGHSVKMMVFGDSSLANHEKYFGRLEQSKTVNELYYVGPHEKEQFQSFLNLTAFKDVLWKRVRDVPANYESGDMLRDTPMDLETNVTAEFTTENSLVLQQGAISKNAVIKIAQAFRTGTNDIDALDYLFMYLNDEKQSHSDLHHFNDVYILDNFRPVVTNNNWRIDCGYDNRLGLPPFFPTSLRFEDYIYRLWI